MATEEITISELELADAVLADMTIPVDTATDTKAVTLRQLKAWLGSSLPTGFIIPAVGKINDARFTLLDGKTLSRIGTYSAFCNKVVEQVQAGNWFSCSEEEYNADISAFGQCGKFVVTNDYVRIPKITRFIGATITLSEIGKSYAESLPNIKGSFVADPQAGAVSGAFRNNDTRKNGRSGSDDYARTVGFNASLSSSVYQDGAKVQPDHTKYPYYMVVSSEGQTEEINVDINQVYEDLELKANRNLSNISADIDYVVEKYQNGTNWYRVYKSGWVEQGGIASAATSNTTINLLKPMKNTNYSVFGSYGEDGDLANGAFSFRGRTTTSFVIRRWSSDALYWQVKGQGA